MSKRGTETRRSESEDACHVCHEPFEVYAIGPCDHPVCYQCSTRMRVLCEQNDCPICRSVMPQVAFVYKPKLFKDIDLRDCIPNRKYKIFFQDEDVEDRYLDLLEFSCQICRNRAPDKTFNQLQTHMRREHQLFACDLCVTHIKIFPFERKFYSRKDLATHRRIGDADDKSYKGHPLCEFCDTRYNDKDELLKHLRKDHYFCHFCDQHCSNAYYDQYPDLMKHFADAHYLCSEGECGNPATRFTHAFVSEIDLKAHVAAEHNKNFTKAQAREARTIEVDFQLAPRRQVQNRGSVITNNDYEETRSNNGGRRNNRRRDQEDEDLKRAIEESKVKSSRAEERVPDPVNDFPTLSGAPAKATPVNTISRPREDDFPSLSRTVKPGTVSQPQSKAYSSAMNFQQSVKPSAPVNKVSKPVSLGSISRNGSASKPTHQNSEDFPSLGNTRPVSAKLTPNVITTRNVSKPASASHATASKSSSKKASRDHWSVDPFAEDYPSLGNERTVPANPSPNVSTVNWIDKTAHSGITPSSQTSNKYNRPLTDKAMNDTKEFPTLGGTGKNDSLRNNLLKTSTWSKPEINKKKVVPKSQKFDEDFEIPNNPKSSTEEVEKSTNGVASLSVKPQDFPILHQKTRDTGGGAAPEKKKKKKKKADENSSASSKSSDKKDVNASLNEIALGLVQNGQDMPIKQNSSGNAKKAVKKPQKVDWFDNPPEEYTSSLNVEAPAKEVKAPQKPKKEEAVVEKPVDDFPSLHAMSTSVQHPKPPPPGFSSESSPSNVSVPPGFVQPSNVSALPPSSLTTNSVFSEPPNFKSRNLQLIQDIRTSLSTTEDGFTHFKAFSGQFRQGLLAASDYYYSCQLIMGDKDFVKIFPELVALLPDINLQFELFQVHQIIGNPKHNSDKLSVCTVCGQVVLPQDSDHHRQGHGMDLDNFPTLGGKVSKSNPNTNTAKDGLSAKGAWIRAK